MYNPQKPDRKRVRIDFATMTLNEVSKQAQKEGVSLSEYLERLVEEDLKGAATT